MSGQSDNRAATRTAGPSRTGRPADQARYASGRAVAAVIAGLLAGGCANGGSGLSTAALPAVPELPKIELPKSSPPVVGTPTEVYERIGRGAMACWFGRDGPLKGKYIYDATAEPPHKGGRAEITIRERDLDAASPRGVKAFRISIEPTQASYEQTTVLAENLKLPEAVGASMRQSVASWSTGQHGCDAAAFASGWDAAPTAAAAAAAAAPVATPQNKATRRGEARVAKP